MGRFPTIASMIILLSHIIVIAMENIQVVALTMNPSWSCYGVPSLHSLYSSVCARLQKSSKRPRQRGSPTDSRLIVTRESVWKWESRAISECVSIDNHAMMWRERERDWSRPFPTHKERANVIRLQWSHPVRNTPSISSLLKTIKDGLLHSRTQQEDRC